jgi:hypothetical protein
LLSIAHYILQPSVHLQLTAFDLTSLGFTANSVGNFFCSKKSEFSLRIFLSSETLPHPLINLNIASRLTN